MKEKLEFLASQSHDKNNHGTWELWLYGGTKHCISKELNIRTGRVL